MLRLRKIIVLLIEFGLIFILIQDSLFASGEEDIVKYWIKEDMEREAIARLEKLAAEREPEETIPVSAVAKAYLPKRGKPDEAETKEEAAKRKLEEMLEKIKISGLHLKDVNLRKVVNEISNRTKVTILVDWTAVNEATDGGITTMNLDMDIYNPMPLKSFLDYLMKLTRLKYRVETHAVLISTPEALKEATVLKVYKLKYGMTKLRPIALKPLGKEK